MPNAVTRIRKPKRASKAPSSSAGSITLPGPDDYNEPPDNFFDYVSLIYGESGIGKTTLLSVYPDSVTLMLEPKRRGIKMRMVEVEYLPMSKMKRVKGETPWQKIEQFIDLCIKDSTVQTVCIDNVGRAYELCMNHVCWDRGINHPNDAKDFGHTWGDVRETFAELFDRVIYSDKGLVFSAKYDFKEVEVRNGENYERLQPSVTKQCFTYLMECTDYGIYYGYHKGQTRSFTIRGDEDVWTKAGPEGRFLDPDGRYINTLSSGNNGQEALEVLVQGFENQLYDIDHSVEEKPKPRKRKVKRSAS